MSQDVIWSKYGASLTIDLDLFQANGADFRVGTAHAVGDTKISKDGAAEVNTVNGFTNVGSGNPIVLTATEMQAQRIRLAVIDLTATKLWLDTAVHIRTYGNASAHIKVDLDVTHPTNFSLLNINSQGGIGNKIFTIVADGGNTASTFKTDLTETVNDFWKPRALIRAVTGANAGQVIALATSGSYDGTTKFITLAGTFASAPATGDTHEIINN